MAVVKNLLVRAGADFSEMKKEMEKTQKTLKEFKSNIENTMKGIGAALGAIGIGAIIKDSVKTAMEFEAALGQISRMMGESASTFLNWVNNNAKAFSMAKSEAIRYGAVYANLLSTFTKDSAETAKYTQDLLKASAVVASSTGRTIDDVMERIRSGLLGNTEAIEDLGININVALIESTKAFRQFAGDRSWDQLDFQTQQQIRYFAILEQAVQKYGLEIANNTNSHHQQFIATLKDIQLYLGQAFMPIYGAVLPALTAMAQAIANVLNVIAQFSQALFGVKTQQQQIKSTQQQAAAVNDLGDAYTEAGKAAKGTIASFDEVHNIQESSGGVAGAGAAGGVPAALDATATAEATVPIADKIQEMANRVKTAFAEMSSFIQRHKDIIIAALVALGTAFATFFIATNWNTIIGGISSAFGSLSKSIKGAWAALTGPLGLLAVAVGLAVGAFVYFYRTNESFRGVVDGILKEIANTAKWLWQSVLVPFGQWLAGAFVMAWDAVKIATQWMWQNVLVPLGEFLLWLWQSVISPLAGILVDVLGIAFKTVGDIAWSLWQNVLVPLGDFMGVVLTPIIEVLSATFEYLWNNVLTPFASFIVDVLKTAFEGFTATIVFLWEKVLEPLVQFLTGVFVKVFNEVFEGIGQLITGLKIAFTGLINFIAGVFTGDWKRAWEGVRDIFKGVFDSLYAIVKTPLNLIIDAINTVIDGLNSIKIDIPDWDWIPSRFRGKSLAPINIPNIPKLAEGGITNGPTLAMIGDNPGGKEVVSPLGDLLDMMQQAVYQAIVDGMRITQATQQQGDREIVFRFDSATWARMTLPALIKEGQRQGMQLVVRPQGV